MADVSWITLKIATDLYQRDLQAKADIDRHASLSGMNVANPDHLMSLAAWWWMVRGSAIHPGYSITAWVQELGGATPGPVSEALAVCVLSKSPDILNFYRQSGWSVAPVMWPNILEDFWRLSLIAGWAKNYDSLEHWAWEVKGCGTAPPSGTLPQTPQTPQTPTAGQIPPWLPAALGVGVVILLLGRKRS